MNSELKSIKNKFKNGLIGFNIPELVIEAFQDKLVSEIEDIQNHILQYDENLVNMFFYDLDEDNSDLFETYSEFKKLTEVLSNNYIGFCREFYFDFKHLNSKENICNISFLESDNHSKSKSVIKVQLLNNTILIYKPRKPTSEDFLYKIFDFFNNFESLLDFFYPSIIESKSGHFMSFVEKNEMLSKLQWNKYYERIGYIFVISYLFDITDLHFDNVIIYGEYPVIVDAETIFNSSIFRKTLIKEIEKDHTQFDFYVDKCGLFDFPFFGSKTIEYKSGSRIYKENDCISLNDKLKYIQIGIDKISQVIVKNRSEIIDIFEFYSKNLRPRFLLRSTSKYYQIINELNHPINLISQNNCNRLLDKYFSQSNILNNDIITSERNSLKMRDIPTFYIEIEKHGALYDNIRKILKFNIDISPKEISLKKIKLFSNQIFESEIRYLINKTNIVKTPKIDCISISNNISDYYKLFIDLHFKKDKTCFLFPSMQIDSSGSMNLDYGNYSIYNGVLGNFILFHHLIIDKDLRDNLIYFTESYLNNFLNNNLINEEINNNNLSIFEGISGLLYFYHLTKNRNLNKLSEAILSHSNFHIEKNSINPYLFEGMGGVILVLSKIEDVKETINFKRLLNRYLDHLEKDYETLNKTGLAHGISGILLVLINTRDLNTRVSKLMLRFLKKEDENFLYLNNSCSDSKTANKIDKNQLSSWCNGFMGVILIRSLMHQLGLIDIKKQSYYNYITDLQYFVSDSNHLCCGNYGEIACLYEIGILLKNDRLKEIAKKYFFKIENFSDLRFPFGHNNLENNFSLMTGLTGVLYYYNKITGDMEIPNLLILE